MPVSWGEGGRMKKPKRFTATVERWVVVEPDEEMVGLYEALSDARAIEHNYPGRRLFRTTVTIREFRP